MDFLKEFVQFGDLSSTWFNTAVKSLAILATSDKLVPSNELSSRMQVESSFIRKVLAKLIKEKLVSVIGGRYGGYQLIVEPSKTTIYDIYIALAKDSYIKNPQLIKNNTDRFILEIILESEKEYSKVLRKYTIEDVKRTFL